MHPSLLQPVTELLCDRRLSKDHTVYVDFDPLLIIDITRKGIHAKLRIAKERQSIYMYM